MNRKITESTRNYNLDLMRVISMLGIIALHLLGNGGIISECEVGSLKYWVSYFMENITFCCVNLFALLTGYLCCNKKSYSSYRILQLIITVFSYCLVITAAFYLFFGSYSEYSPGILNSIFPALAGRYWYITCYIALFFLMPYINSFIDSIGTEKTGKLCLILIILFSIIPSLCGVDFFKLSDGYSTAWLIVCYILGAYMKKSKKRYFKGKEIYIFLVSSLLVVLIRFVILKAFNQELDYFMTYTSPLILLSALALLQLATNTDGSGWHPIFKKAVKTSSGFAFDVYALHCQILVFDLIISNRFSWIINKPFYLIPFLVIICCLLIYSVCMLVAYILNLIFGLIKADKPIKFVAGKLDKFLGWDKQNQAE